MADFNIIRVADPEEEAHVKKVGGIDFKRKKLVNYGPKTPHTKPMTTTP